MTTAVCDRASGCLNFWLASRPVCNECGVPITMSHFHHNTQYYRICHDCFEKNLADIEANTYIPKTLIRGEVRACLNHNQCFATEPYGMYRPKVCDNCGALAPPEHYHDIEQNIRLCLPCYKLTRL